MGSCDRDPLEWAGVTETKISLGAQYNVELRGDECQVGETMGPFCANFKLNTKQRILLKKCEEFYAVSENVDKYLAPMLRRSGPCSFRLVYHFITNYSARHTCSVKSKAGVYENAYSLYLAVQNYCGRKNLDFFARSRKRGPDGRLRSFTISLQDSAGETLNSTVSQLYGIFWYVTNGIWDYVLRHKAQLEGDMRLCSKQRRESRSKKGKKDRVSAAPLSILRQDVLFKASANNVLKTNSK